MLIVEFGMDHFSFIAQNRSKLFRFYAKQKEIHRNLFGIYYTLLAHSGW